MRNTSRQQHKCAALFHGGPFTPTSGKRGKTNRLGEHLPILSTQKCDMITVSSSRNILEGLTDTREMKAAITTIAKYQRVALPDLLLQLMLRLLIVR